MISNVMSVESDIVAKFSNEDENPTLIILDRRDDPVTPLLNQWTYQSMIHELIGINNHRVKLENGEEVVISPDQDEFFSKNMYKNYGEMAEELNKLVDEFKSKNKSQAKVESIEDMQRFMETYPEFKKYSGNVTKHVNIMGEISKKVNAKKLFQVSEVEQGIAIKSSKSEHTKEVEEIVNDIEVDNLEKVRLVMLYAIRYESESSNIRKFKNMLKDNGVKPEHIKFIDYVLEYAGKKKRSPFLFGKKDILSSALNIFRSTFNDVQNVFTQHKSSLCSIIDLQMKGKLNVSDFPYVAMAPEEKKTNDIIVFVIGGATYQEAKEVADFNNMSQEHNIILGSTHIHNMMTFIAEALQVEDYD